jgi:hypothetical protein
MKLGPTECDSLDLLSHREWLETDGLGNYAAGTVSGINTRRRHGWLVAGDDPSDGSRRLLLAKCEETLFVGGSRQELGANQYPDTIHPQGYRFLVEFRLDPWPVWVYRVEDVLLERHLLLLPGAAATVFGYRLLAGPGLAALEVRPLVAGRGIDATANENQDFARNLRSRGEQVELTPYGEASRLVLSHPRARFVSDGFWFYSFRYLRDAERGEVGGEDLYNPGLFLCNLHPGETCWLAASRQPLDGLDLDAAVAAEAKRRAAVAALAATPTGAALRLAAEAYLVRLEGQAALLPSYPWTVAPDWRDLGTLATLSLAAGRPQHAAEALTGAAAALADPDTAPLGAGLALAWAAQCHLAAGGGPELVDGLLRPALARWAAAVRGGQWPGLAVDGDDGLLSAQAEPEPQQTQALWRLAVDLGDGAALSPPPVEPLAEAELAGRLGTDLMGHLPESTDEQGRAVGAPAAATALAAALRRSGCA